MKLPFTQVDAFAHMPFTGNQAVVMPLDAWLDDAILQSIANEHAVAETAFVVRDTDSGSDYELRWFTPVVEVALCGHATLASAHVLLAENGGDSVTFRTRTSGILSVQLDRNTGHYALALPAIAGAPKALPELAKAMGGPVSETYWHPNGYGLFVYADAGDVAALAPDMAALTAAGDILYIATAPGVDASGAAHPSGADVVSRVFAPAAGIPEDPATGSAHSMITCYWSARLGRTAFSAYQASARGAHFGCTQNGDRVVLTGQCVTTLTGLLHF